MASITWDLSIFPDRFLLNGAVLIRKDSVPYQNMRDSTRDQDQFQHICPESGEQRAESGEPRAGRA